jgi:hypothetical protein
LFCVSEVLAVTVDILESGPVRKAEFPDTTMANLETRVYPIAGTTENCGFDVIESIFLFGLMWRMSSITSAKSICFTPFFTMPVSVDKVFNESLRALVESFLVFKGIEPIGTCDLSCPKAPKAIKTQAQNKKDLKNNFIPGIAYTKAASKNLRVKLLLAAGFKPGTKVINPLHIG